MKPFHLPRWSPYLLIAAFVCALAAAFLFPSPNEFPMDDTYIHFVYANNLAGHGRLFFNEIGEVGVGSTSLAWVVLLAGAILTGIPVHIAAKALGLLSLVLAGWGLYRLAQGIWPRQNALALALLVTGSGHFLWFALSGMETMLFLALGLTAILLYQQKKWFLTGAVTGVVVLTRPDGLALLGAFVLVEMVKTLAEVRQNNDRYTWWSNPTVTRTAGNLARLTAVCLIICGPWFLYLFDRTGHFLPTSAIGKQTSSMLALSLISSRSPLVGFLLAFPGILYAGAWIVYLLEFVLGGMALPGPQASALNVGGNAGYTVSLLSVAGWGLVVLPLIVAFGKDLARWWKERRCLDGRYASLLALGAWTVLHNLMYAFFLPIPGTASRYGVMNHVVLWLALALGLRALVKERRSLAGTGKGLRGRWMVPGLAAGLLLIAASNTAYWNRVYDANLEHMINVRIAAARYVQGNLPAQAAIAGFDIGAIRYFSGRQVVDLGGLVDPQLGSFYQSEGRIDSYLAERGVTYVVLPGQTGKTDEGWFDFAREMGLTDSDLFQLNLVEIFAIDYQRWLLGYLPTNNYQATVTVYSLRYR